MGRCILHKRDCFLNFGWVLKQTKGTLKALVPVPEADKDIFDSDALGKPWWALDDFGLGFGGDDEEVIEKEKDAIKLNISGTSSCFEADELWVSGLAGLGMGCSD